jgi:4-carboxymuconolactone decarboxylase
VREVAILTTAREMDSQFEWVAHEDVALKEGVPQEVIDIIKHRRRTAGIDSTDALVIELGRQIWRDHKVKPETFALA